MIGPKTNVLYVDDEENNLVSFRASFRREYNIFTAASATEGLLILGREQIPVVLTDQRMPDITGVQFLEKVVQQFPDTIRMVVTGYTDVEAIIQCINAGRIFRYITKPWDEKELRMTLNNAANLYELQRHNKNLLEEVSRRMDTMEKTVELFKRYVPPSIVEKTLQATDESGLFEGELREVSALFCDIRYFTELSESLQPQQVVALLNDYYRILGESVNRHNGIINQYVGDEIFAVFGAPLRFAEDHCNAVFCALEMRSRLKDLNEKYRDQFGKEIIIGIGINTGTVVAGNMGFRDKMAYTVAGDTINTAKRIESLTRETPNAILINSTTWERVHDLFECTAWPPVFVKGKSQQLQLYEVKGQKIK